MSINLSYKSRFRSNKLASKKRKTIWPAKMPYKIRNFREICKTSLRRNVQIWLKSVVAMTGLLHLHQSQPVPSAPSQTHEMALALECNNNKSDNNPRAEILDVEIQMPVTRVQQR